MFSVYLHANSIYKLYCCHAALKQLKQIELLNEKITEMTFYKPKFYAITELLNSLIFINSFENLYSY